MNLLPRQRPSSPNPHLRRASETDSTTTFGSDIPEWIQPNGESPIYDWYKARLMELLRQRLDAKKGTMCMRTITARFTDESVNLDDAEECRVLTTLRVIYEGGPLHGNTADFPTRDFSYVVVGFHQRNWHFFETYQRTVYVDVRSRRTICRWTGLPFKSDNSSWWKRLLKVLPIRKLKAIVI